MTADIKLICNDTVYKNLGFLTEMTYCTHIWKDNRCSDSHNEVCNLQ